MTRRYFGLSRVLVLAAPLLLLGAVSCRPMSGEGVVRVRILAINDFHGQLSAGSVLAGRPVGGAPVLAAYLERAMAGMAERTLIVQAGDLVGASPVASGLLQDEPTIAFFNQLGNRFCTTGERANPRCNLLGVPGNHEFDEGVIELRRLLRGGNHPRGPFLQAPWRGAAYPTLCANVVNRDGGPLFPPLAVEEIAGARIGFVGAVLAETPRMVMRSGVAGLRFLDPARSIDRAVRALKAMGVRAIVVVVHQGGTQSGTVIEARSLFEEATFNRVLSCL